jgi:hypothetical protein
MPISHRHPERWYLQLAREARLPEFATPEVALGRDLLEMLPAGAEGARWRALLNEAQVILHNHPVNAQRAARGAVAANSLWFWGGGLLPDAVSTTVAGVRSEDVELQALARLAGVDSGNAGTGDKELVDLRHERDWSRVEREFITPWRCSPHPRASCCSISPTVRACASSAASAGVSGVVLCARTRMTPGRRVRPARMICPATLVDADRAPVAATAARSAEDGSVQVRARGHVATTRAGVVGPRRSCTPSRRGTRSSPPCAR